MSRIAVCIPTRNDNNEPGTLAFPLVTLAVQSYRDLEVYVRDEGKRDAYADRSLRGAVSLLAQRGIGLNYTRTADRRGAGHARHSLFKSIKNEELVLWLDDDMILEPEAVARLLEVLDPRAEVGFAQGTKVELDPFRCHQNDINRLNSAGGPCEPFRIWFGDTALLLVRTEALRQIDWDVVTRYQLDGLCGEDVSMSLMVAQRYEGWGVPEARGWHLSPTASRWTWEASSDALQTELLRGKVAPDILRKAMPHMAPFISENGEAGDPEAPVPPVAPKSVAEPTEPGAPPPPNGPTVPPAPTGSCPPGGRGSAD